MSYESDPSTAERTGPIRVDQFEPYDAYPEEYARRFVTVQRSSGDLDSGWIVDGEVTDEQGNEKYVLQKLDDDGNPLEKRVDKARIDQLQADLFAQNEALHRPRKLSEGLAHAAVGPTTEVDLPDRQALSVDEKVALGWAVTHDEIDAAEAEKEVTAEKARNEKLFSFPDAAKADRYGGSMRERTTVTEESARDAAMAYRFADDEIKKMIRADSGDAWREADMAEVLRGNNELRVRLGTYFLEKMESMTNLPERVWYNASNNMKNPNFPGYADVSLTSREYTAILALSMLDGTFKAGRSPFDKIGINQYSEVIHGQHRYAAHKVLGTERFANVERLTTR